MSYKDLPPIRRARDYHLYAADGKRYLDLYSGGGRALFGHKPEGLSLILKTGIQKGLLAEVPGAAARRLEKALLRLAGDAYRVRLYANFDRALAAASKLLGRAIREQDIAEPFFASGGGGGAAYYRPFAAADYSPFTALFPVLPFPGGFAPQPLFYKAENAGGETPAEPPESDGLSPFLAAALARLAGRLAGDKLKPGAESPDIWKEWRLPGWKRFGCYCFRESGANYAEVYRRFLESGVILPAEARRPAILPGLFSAGEKALVERLAAETFGETHE